MATYRFNCGDIFIPEDFSFEYFVTPTSGFPISGAGTSANPWLVEAGDTVGFIKTNGSNRAINGLAIFTNNSITVTSTLQTRTVASGSTLLDSFTFGLETFYFQRTLTSDTTPDQFSLGADVTGAAVSTDTFRNFTVTGINADVTAVASDTGTGIAKVGPTASGPWLDSVGGIGNNDVVYCRFTSPTGTSSTSTYTVTIGSVSDSMDITTVAPNDGDPDQFSLGADIDNVELDSLHYRQFTVTGINVPVTVTASGTGCRISATATPGGPWTTSLTSITNGTVIYCRFRSSGANYSTTRVMTVTIGSVSDSVNVTTRAIDDDPTAFNLGQNQSDLGRNITVPLQSFTISGMDTGATITVTGSGTASTQVSKNNADFFTSLTGISNGDTIYSRGTTSSSYSSNTTATVTANSVSDSVVLTTEANPTAGNNEIPFPVTSGNPISIDDIASFFAGTSVGRPDNLGAFYRGGTYVPNITTNTNIPTSGAISMGDFYGSATEFTFVMINSYKAAAITEGTGTQTLNLFWSIGDWDVGPGGALDIGTEYRFSNFVIDYREGQPVDPGVTQGSQTFSASNNTFTVSATLAQNIEYFCYGTLTIEARPPSNPSTVEARTVNWTFTVFGTN